MGETNTDDTKRLREQAMRRQAALRAAMQAEQRAEIPGAFQRRFGGTGQPLAPSQAGAGLPLSGPETTRQRLDRLAALAPSADSTLPAGATPERIQEAARAALAAGDTAAARGLSLMAVEAEMQRRAQGQPALTESQGAAPIQIHLPNNTILEFPAGTSQDVMAQAIDRLVMEREAQEPGRSGFNASGLAAVRRRAGQGQGASGSLDDLLPGLETAALHEKTQRAAQSFLVPGATVPAGVDANALGAPPPNAATLASLLTPEGQAARRASGAGGAGSERDELLRLAQDRQAAARGITVRAGTPPTGADLRAEIDANSVHEASLWEQAGLTPSQMGTAFRENINCFRVDGLRLALVGERRAEPCKAPWASRIRWPKGTEEPKGSGGCPRALVTAQYWETQPGNEDVAANLGGRAARTGRTRGMKGRGRAGLAHCSGSGPASSESRQAKMTCSSALSSSSCSCSKGFPTHWIRRAFFRCCTTDRRSSSSSLRRDDLACACPSRPRRPRRPRRQIGCLIGFAMPRVPRGSLLQPEVERCGRAKQAVELLARKAPLTGVASTGSRSTDRFDTANSPSRAQGGEGR